MNLDAVHRFIIAYDVGDDPRRNRVARALASFGDRMQYSLFLVDIKPAKLLRLRGLLCNIIDPATDSVLICDLGPLAHGGQHRIEMIGASRPVTSQGPLIM